MPADKKHTAAKLATDPIAEAKEEEELEGSLARLQAVLRQLGEIRVAMQKMLHPLHATAADPELVYAAFADSAQKTVSEIKEFQTAMRDDKMKDLLKKGREWAFKQESSNSWIGGLTDSQQADEDTSAVVNGLDTIKIERQDTPKKG